MGLPAGLLPPAIAAGVEWLVALIVLIAAWGAPWRRLAAGERQHVFLGSVLGLACLWSLEAGVSPGLGFHFLAVTVFTLMFGWCLAVLGVGLAFAGLAVANGTGLASLAPDALVLGVVPITASYLIYAAVHRFLPHHIFIYIYLCGFLAAILATGLSILIIVSLLIGFGLYSYAQVAYEYLPYLPLFLLPEGLINGMITTVLVGARPQWLATYDDASYLNR